MHESITSLNSIIKNTKEQLQADIAKTQTYFNQSSKNLSKTIDILKQNFSAKIQMVNNDMKNLNSKMDITQEKFNAHQLGVKKTLK